MENIKLKKPVSFLKKSNRSTLFKLKKIVLFFLVFNFQYSYCQLNNHNILTPKISKLKSEGKHKEASTMILDRLEQLSSQITDKNIATDSLLKYYNYYLKHEKSETKRNAFHEKLLELNLQAASLDTMQLVKSYLIYAGDLANTSLNYSKALVIVEKGIATWETYYDKPLAIYAKLNSLKGAILLNLRLEGASFEQFERTAKIYESVEKKNLLDLWELYNGLARSYDRYGFYDKAIYYIQKAEAVMRSDKAIKNLKKIAKKDGTEYQFVLSNLGTVTRIYKNTNNESGVIASIKKIEAYIADKQLDLMSKYHTSGGYNYAGLYYLNDKKEYEKAILYFEKALQIIPQEHFKSTVDYYTLNTLKARVGLNSSTKTIDALNTYLKERPNLARQLKGIAYQSKTLLNLKNNLRADAIEDAQFAINSFSKSSTDLNILSDSVVANYRPTKKIRDVSYIVSMADAFNDLDIKTDSTLIASNKLYNIALKQFKACYSRNFYSNKLENIYNKIINGLLTTNNLDLKNNISTNDLLNTVINDKSNFLWHNFLVNRQNDHLKIPDSLTRKEKSLRQELLSYQTKEVEENYTPAEYKTMIVGIKEELESLSKTINTDYATFNFFDSNSFNLSAFRQQLEAKEAVLYYQNLENSLFCFVITKLSINFFSVANFSSIEKTIIKFTKDAGNLNSSIDTLRKTGEDLYKVLQLDKIKDYIKVTIVPDKILNYLPFELLTENGKYLIENKTISYTTALPLLQYNLNAENLAKKNSSLLFASTYVNFQEEALQLATRDGDYNLEGAISEAKLLEKITKGKLFSGAKASKANFISNAKNSNVLHLAMHAFLNNENPELSYLAFSDNIKNNKMYISELYGLNLNSNLAVLSACNTGIGNIISGKGMVSLNRAFTYAGVPTTISSLWSVPDETTKNIIVDFYKNLDKGLASSQALQEAKLTFLNTISDQELKHPYYWAGFVQHGKDVTVKFNQGFSIWKWVLGFITLFLILFTYFRIRHKL